MYYSKFTLILFFIFFRKKDTLTAFYYSLCEAEFIKG